ncbi:MAG: pantoate--beta-alanine ligase [Gemmatimonadales bacterium]|nr:pantoate--beta-alanine ligase [Gemmatimonadales bacterium]
MGLVTSVDEFREARRAWAAQGVRVSLVPTMGYLHEGHLRLIDAAKERSDVVVVSVFVNPLQFGPEEDYDQYPRDLERDRRLAVERGAAVIFAPDADVMYPAGSEIRVVPGTTAERWEGLARPGHFVGVLTVVAKLFHMTNPHVACFGQKDYQQLALIRQMVRDLNWSIEVVGVPTVREPDGLAMSSRNVYLSAAERREALSLSGALSEAHAAWRAGESSASTLEVIVRQRVEVCPSVALEYIAVVDPDRLEPVDRVDHRSVIAVAARVGPTRLIDNIILRDGLSGAT